MYLTILALPLLGSVLSSLFGRFLGKSGSEVLTTVLVLVASLFSWVALYEVGISGCPTYLDGVQWVFSGGFYVKWFFIYDSLSSIMLVVVTTISVLVHVYSADYMSGDPHGSRYFSYLSLFTFFMLVLVTSGNLVQLFVGWEGVGVCSYLLINFWYTRVQANKSALKAIIVNRVGDVGVILGMALLYYSYRSLDFGVIFPLTPYLVDLRVSILSFEVSVVTISCVLLFVGVVGKSAQLGLHVWLPDAMEGPTPVSALIHAATMVTAGVFLLVRCSPLFEYSGWCLILVSFVGASTAFFAATTGLAQNDVKRVVAYSTCSQLGYMVFACGLSSYSVSMFHLVNHAFFKALLFLGAGSVIHALGDEQDIRKMGGLSGQLPITYSSMLIGSLALAGVPYLSGFYSKDAILEVAHAKYSIEGVFSYWLGAISALFTAYYSFRLLYMVFLSKPNGFKCTIVRVQEASSKMVLVLMVLGASSIFVGYFLKDMIIGLGTPFWGGSIYSTLQHYAASDSEFIPTAYKVIPTLFSMVGSILCLLLYRSGLFSTMCVSDLAVGRTLYKILNGKWFFDALYNGWVVQGILRLGYSVTFRLLDKGYLEFLGPLGLQRVILRLSQGISSLHTGYVSHSMMMAFYGFFCISSGWYLLSGLSTRDFILTIVYMVALLGAVNR